MSNKPLPGFISNLGRHNLRSLGKDLNLDKAQKISKKVANKRLNSAHHGDLSQISSRVSQFLQGAGLKIGGDLTFKVIESAVNHFISDANSHTSLSEINRIASENLTKYITTHVHLGKPTSRRIKLQNNTPLVQLNTKDLSNSQKDYIEHDKHKELTLTTGFNQKSFSFLMESTFLSIKDLIKFFTQDPSVKRNLLKKNLVSIMFTELCTRFLIN